MNRSYSKIRHIQEANQRLENRLLNEQTAPVTTNTTTVANPNTNFEDWFKKQNIKMPKAKREITISATESSTLESIAKEHGVTVADILKDNPGKTNDNLKPGETLCFQGYDIEM